LVLVLDSFSVLVFVLDLILVFIFLFSRASVYIAAAYGSPRMLQLLLEEYKCSPNAESRCYERDTRGTWALYHCAQNQNVECIKYANFFFLQHVRVNWERVFVLLLLLLLFS
jgi:hypothetical protein